MDGRLMHECSYIGKLYLNYIETVYCVFLFIKRAMPVLGIRNTSLKLCLMHPRPFSPGPFHFTNSTPSTTCDFFKGRLSKGVKDSGKS